MKDFKKLSSIAANISPENAQDLEDGKAEVRITPIVCDENTYLVVFVNGQAVYAPHVDGRMDTYTACSEAIEQYMNSY